ncbi:endoglucanase B [Fusarium heterosporum]|uniref:lytic cellulose monooxygenase (C4-dehydrogenating) n=1 Tax=Fusarium heterosporum TaxID=42747 RepID=A0A8H5WHA5_FUSHE|nr:endoglucanase B [Fusarium heterosporum]
MRFSATAATLAMATTVTAHAQVYGLWVNGEDQGDGRNVYIRSPENNNPVKDLTSPDLVCNVNGGKAAPKFAKAAAGDEVTFEWYHNTRGDDIIDGSHKGPIITYVAPYTETDGTGAIWTKIAEDGYSGGKWAVDKLIANKGKATFTLPASLKAGKYIVRQEIIAHHESDVAFKDNSARGAQFYPSCAQVEVTGSGTSVPDEKFDFNKGYTYTDKGIVGVDVYNFSGTYDMPGPAVWTAASSGSGSDSGSETKPEAPATTSAASNDSGAEAPAPTPTFATVVRPSEEASAPAATATAAPVTPPKTGCSSRRRRARRAARNAL